MIIPTTFAAEGFGLNLKVFDTNIINLAVVIFGLYKFLPGFLGKMLEKRRNAILVDLKDAEEKLNSAVDQLKDAQKNLTLAEQKANQIMADSQKRAELIRSESEIRTIEEMARIKDSAVSDSGAEASRMSSKLRLDAAELAIKKVLESLPNRLDEQSQANLINQTINDLEIL
tara:strand:- start:22653 stop:23168 length:516 start_codon:yes stop_codon:yes gene_type:complete